MFCATLTLPETKVTQTLINYLNLIVLRERTINNRSGLCVVVNCPENSLKYVTHNDCRKSVRTRPLNLYGFCYIRKRFTYYDICVYVRETGSKGSKLKHLP